MDNNNLDKLEILKNKLIVNNYNDFCKNFTEFLNTVEKDFESFFNKDDKKHIDCKAGCGICCRVNVSLLLPEVFNIINYLENNFNKIYIENLKNKLNNLYPMIKGFDDEERMIAGVKCPFLSNNNNCQIYNVRPLLCRSVTSTSAERCEQAVIDIVFGIETPIIMNLKQQEYYEKIYIHLANLIYKNKMDDRGVKLIEALHIILNKKYTYNDFFNGEIIPI